MESYFILYNRSKGNLVWIYEFIDASECGVSRRLIPGPDWFISWLYLCILLNENARVYLLAWICQFEFSCIWMWGIGREVSRRPRQIYVLHLGKCWKISENISTNPCKTGTARDAARAGGAKENLESRTHPRYEGDAWKDKASDFEGKLQVTH